MTSLTRRLALKIIGMGSAWLGLQRITHGQDSGGSSDDATTISWTGTHDRVWLCGEIWANPMEDWRVIDGMAECQSMGGNRNLQLITHQITDSAGSLSMSVLLQQVESRSQDGGAGFRIGIRSELNEYRSNSFASGGINAGVIDGNLLLGNKRQPLDVDVKQKIKLSLSGRPSRGRYELTLSVHDAEGGELEQLTQLVSAESILGNVALVNSFDPKQNQRKGARYRFNDWTVAGDALTAEPEQKFGPLLWSMYSLSDSRGDEGFVMKISALTGPLGESDNKDVELMVGRGDQWHSLGSADLDTDAWTATFRVPNWDEKTATPYKLVYREKLRDGSEVESSWSGTIKPNPSGRPLRIGALTCQNHYGFPYQPVAENVIRLDPDLLYFSGDQLYESHGGYGLIREPAEPAILNYLRKYYMFGWSFRQAMRDCPTICIADDHDVFQGNIWGEGGAPMDIDAGGASSNGGYREPARMVNVVHKTNTAHHPDYYDPTPAKQGISVYYGDMVYGGVGFAILGDRQFKSGPQRVETGSGRADHVKDINVDTLHLDKPGLELLGQRQEDFLRKWGDDWRGHTMKVLLSQTVFAGVATHHGGYNGYLKADLDSGGWPQTARNQAIRIIRKAMPLHINGDQHLTSLVQYGADEQRDGCWSFCTPAIAAGYPRWWRPDEVGMPHQNRPSHDLPDTGEYLDGFGNKVYVYAVGNPEVGTNKNRYEKAHQKGSGFGLVTIDTDARTYKIESFRFLIDATDGKASNQFPGWPVTLHQKENRGDDNIIG
jgi:alkaline phosphatase D